MCRRLCDLCPRYDLTEVRGAPAAHEGEIEGAIAGVYPTFEIEVELLRDRVPASMPPVPTSPFPLGTYPRPLACHHRPGAALHNENHGGNFWEQPLAHTSGEGELKKTMSNACHGT